MKTFTAVCSKINISVADTWREFGVGANVTAVIFLSGVSVSHVKIKRKTNSNLKSSGTKRNH